MICVVPGEPSDIKIDAVRGHWLRVKWSPPLEPNGHILGYQVRIHHFTPQGEQMTSEPMNASNTEYVIYSLEPETEYLVSVNAFTSKGQGAISSPLPVTTLSAGE